jgi:hypothetical protein
LKGKIKEELRNCFLELEYLEKPNQNQINAHQQPITGFSNWCTPGCWVPLAPELNTGHIKFTGNRSIGSFENKVRTYSLE